MHCWPLPLPVHGRLGHAEDGSDFLVGHSSEEAQLHEPGLPRGRSRELLESPIEGEKVHVARSWISRLFCQRDLQPAPGSLDRAPGPRMIDQDPAHDLRGDGEELGAVLPSLACGCVVTSREPDWIVW